MLHLNNLGDSDDEFLCYGITEDLIVDLTRLGSIRVAPMRAVLKYRESETELEDIARSLSVRYVLDGSIMRSKEKIRVSAQLVDTHELECLWANRWEEPTDNLPGIKQALARGIADAMHLDQPSFDAVSAGKPDAKNPEAYEYYLRGKYVFEHRKDTSDIGVAAGLYNRALELEPTLLAARAGLGEILMHQGDLDRALGEIKATISDAERTDLPSVMATGHRLMAKYYMRRANWTDAEQHGQKSVKIGVDTGDLAGEAESLGLLISVMLPQAKFDDALKLFDRVLEINRQLEDQERVTEALKNIGTVYRQKGDYDNARKHYEEALALARKQGSLAPRIGLPRKSRKPLSIP